MSADHQEIDLRKFFFVSVVPIGYKFVHLTIGGIKAALDEKKFSHRILMEYEELCSGSTVKEHQKDYERFFTVKECCRCVDRLTFPFNRNYPQGFHLIYHFLHIMALEPSGLIHDVFNLGRKYQGDILDKQTPVHCC